MRNADTRTVESFGAEWTTFDQTGASPVDLDRMFEEFFLVFPWGEISTEAEGFDVGCGSGRWAARVAPRVGKLHCVDASSAALDSARRALDGQDNCVFHEASVDCMPIPDASMDFGYALGVLHHVPEPLEAIRSCVEKLRPGAPLLVYMYYALDNRPPWFRLLWKATDLARRAVCRMPHTMKVVVTSAIAVTVYWPFARLARAAEDRGRSVESFPLAYYRRRGLYTMRTDALDRFGTPLERRFTSAEVVGSLQAAGLEDVELSPEPPFWCAVGRRAARSGDAVSRESR